MTMEVHDPALTRAQEAAVDLGPTLPGHVFSTGGKTATQTLRLLWNLKAMQGAGKTGADKTHRHTDTHMPQRLLTMKSCTDVAWRMTDSVNRTPMHTHAYTKAPTHTHTHTHSWGEIQYRCYKLTAYSPRSERQPQLSSGPWPAAGDGHVLRQDCEVLSSRASQVQNNHNFPGHVIRLVKE